MYWEITPHHTNDFDCAILPSRNEDDDRAALAYAQERLEALWDATAYGQKKITVTMELCEGEMPETENDEC